MKITLVLGMAVMLGWSAVAVGQEDDEVLAVTKVRDAILEAYNTQNVEELMKHFHQDIGFLIPSRPYIEGHDAVKTMYEQLFTRMRETDSCGYLSPIREETVIAGEWAWVRGESRFMRSECGSVPPAIHALRPGSKHLGIYKKENGRWLRYRQMRNGNTPEMNI